MPARHDIEHDRPDQARLEQDALAWVLRLTSGEATESDREAFLRWRARGPQYEAATTNALRLWQQVGNAAAIAHPRSRIPSRRTFLQGGAIAASTVGLAFAGAKLGFLPTAQDIVADYRTVAGEQRRIDLPGDVTVELNTRSGLSLGDENDRHLKLVSGEAAFTSRARQGSELVLSAGEATVAASDAVFLARIDGNKTTVSCLQGNLQLSMPEPKSLKVGQQAICENGRVQTGAIADIEAVSAWRKGQLIFRDERLGNVASELNRYKRGLVLVVDSSAAERRVSGVFHLRRVDEALDHIGSALGLPVRHLSRFLTMIG